jgi:hypothetical protein
MPPKHFGDVQNPGLSANRTRQRGVPSPDQLEAANGNERPAGVGVQKHGQKRRCEEQWRALVLEPRENRWGPCDVSFQLVKE